MTPEIAKTGEYDVTPMGPILEADDFAGSFATAQAVHEVVDGDRVEIVLKIDDERR